MTLAMSALLFGAVNASAQSDIVLQASNTSARAGRWAVVSDSGAAGGAKIRHADAGAAKIDTAAASPANYFELTFSATKGVPYRLWVHGRADGDDAYNDSVFVQFAGSVNSSGGAVYRIGTTAATEVNLEPCKGCGLERLDVAGQRVGLRGAGPGHLLRDDRHPADARADARRRDLDRSDHPVAIAVPEVETARDFAGIGRLRQRDRTSSYERTMLKVLDWNIHHGVGTDGNYNISRIADWIVKTGANVVSLNEVEKYTGWGNEDQPARFASLLKSKTGKTWYYNFAQRDGNTNGQGNLILSTYQLESNGDHQLSYSRSVARVAIIVNGIRVNVYSTHLDADSSSRRSTQMRELLSWADNYPEQRIIAGDFNAWPGATEIGIMKADYNDSWAVGAEPGRRRRVFGQHRRQHAQQPHRLHLALGEAPRA